MPQDLTDSVDLESKLTQSQALAAALDDDHDNIDLGSSDDEPTALSARDLRSSLARDKSAADEVDDDDDIFSADPPDEVPDPLAAKPAAKPAEDDETKFSQAVFDRAKKAGFDASKYRSVNDFLSGVANLASKLGQRDQVAAYGQQLLDSPEEVYKHLREHLKKQGKIKDDSAPAAPAPSADDAPEYDEAWLDLVDENGKAKEGADPKSIASLKKWNSWVRTRSQALLRDPAAIVRAKLEPDFKKLVESTIEERLGKVMKDQDEKEQMGRAFHERASVARQVYDEESPWVFKDKADPAKGLSPAGEVFRKWVNYYESPDPATGMPRMYDIREIRDAAKARTHVELSMTANKDGRGKPAPAAPAAKPSRAAPKRPSARAPTIVDLERALLQGMKLGT